MSGRSEPPTPRGRRVFVGVWEISNIVYTIGEALRAADYEVETLVIGTPFNRYYAANRYDDSVGWPAGDRIWRDPVGRTRFNLQMLRRLARAIRRFDIFVFVWRYSFLPLQLDILLLRLLGKRVILFWCGDDVRFKPAQIVLDTPRVDQPWFPVDRKHRDRWLSWGRTFWEAFWTTKLGEKTGCQIVAPRDAATFQAIPYSSFVIPQPMLSDAPRGPREPPLVVHAPSDPVLKGTSYVEAAVERLRQEGLSFEFRLVRDTPIDDLHDVLREADVVIDQPGVWVGRLGLEAMAAGAVVVGGNQPRYWGVPDESPVVQFERDPDGLAATLRRLLSDPQERGARMARSREYVERTYSFTAFANFFAALARGEQPSPIHPVPEQRAVARSTAPGFLQRAAVDLLW